MSLLLGVLVRLLAFLLVAPLLPGIVQRVRARVAGRRGPPLLQPLHDLGRLARKGVVVSTTASPGLVAGPAVAWVAVLGAALLVPMGPLGACLSFPGDVIVFVYLLALARFATAWAALESGSAFGGMGAAREVSYAVITEATVVTALLASAVASGSTSLTGLYARSVGPGAALLAGAWFTVLLAETCRVPFDDPTTHLELTMVHEAMVLDHSGPPLAVALHAASMKLLLFSILLVQAIAPTASLGPAAQVAVLAAGVLLVTGAVGLVESFLARYAFRRVPLLLATAFVLALFALLIASSGGAP